MENTLSNVHAPQRLADETQAQYRMRRTVSRAIVKTMTKGPTQAPAVNQLDVSRFFLGQHENALKNRVRALKAKAAAAKRRKGLPAIAAPKFDVPRKHKPAQHPLRDDIGAYTLTGAHLCEPRQGQTRRKWVAGISAQRKSA